jgi:hypothetical protein
LFVCAFLLVVLRLVVQFAGSVVVYWSVSLAVTVSVV